MAEKQNSDVLRSLPRTRPHRRSEKRGVRTSEPAAGAVQSRPADPGPKALAGRTQNGAARTRPPRAKAGGAKPKPAPANAGGRRRKPTTLRQPAQPPGAPPGRRADRPAEQSRPDVLGTAVQAAAELAEIGLSVGARAIRGAVSRLPKP